MSKYIMSKYIWILLGFISGLQKIMGPEYNNNFGDDSDSSWVLVDFPTSINCDHTEILNFEYFIKDFVIEGCCYYKFELIDELQRHKIIVREACKDTMSCLINMRFEHAELTSQTNIYEDKSNATPVTLWEIVSITPAKNNSRQGKLSCKNLGYSKIIPETDLSYQEQIAEEESGFLTEIQITAIEHYLRMVRRRGTQACKKGLITARDFALAALASTSNNPRYQQK